MVHLVARSQARTLEEALQSTARRVIGSYSLTFLCNGRVYGLRDPHGLRPLVLGELPGLGWILASETCALEALGATYLRELNRGELVEIGGSFRVPDVMRASGARLHEVGTTNRTHLRDYRAGIGPETGALLKVHRSNFAIVGFTAEVAPAELARCAHEAGLLCLYDLGSGALAGSAAGLDPPEPTVEAALAAGCDVVSFSCDKLLGGPQAGVLCGSRASIEPLRQHPLLRALRPDKLTLLALTATLELYRDGRSAEIPTVAMLAADGASLRARAESLQALCSAAGLAVEILPTRSAVGGGAMPLVEPASWAVSPCCDAAQARRMEVALRQGSAESAVVARLAGDRLLCDVRTVSEGELPALAQALVAARGA